MNPIEVCYASGAGVLVDTLEATYEGMPAPYLFCSGFEEVTCGTEDGRMLTFLPMAMELALPANDNSVFQSLVIGIDNTTGEAQEAIEDSREAGKRMTIIFRRYLYADLARPKEKYRLSLLSRDYQNDAEQRLAKLTAGFYDLLNTNGMRDRLTASRAPGLRFI